MNAPEPQHACIVSGCDTNATIIISDPTGQRTDFVCDHHYNEMQPPEPPKLKASM